MDGRAKEGRPRARGGGGAGTGGGGVDAWGGSDSAPTPGGVWGSWKPCEGDGGGEGGRDRGGDDGGDVGGDGGRESGGAPQSGGGAGIGGLPLSSRYGSISRALIRAHVSWADMVATAWVTTTRWHGAPGGHVHTK